MAQNFLIANLTKREFFRPERMSPGPTFRDFAFEGSAFKALGFLLSYSTDRHALDPNWERQGAARFFGHWAGDAVVVIGDFFIPSLARGDQRKALPTFHEVEQDFLDIGGHLIQAWNDMEPGLGNQLRDMTMAAPPATAVQAARYLRDHPDLAVKVNSAMTVQVLAPGLAQVGASGGQGTYEVELRCLVDANQVESLQSSCSCPQGRIRKEECKHVAAYAAFLAQT